MTMTRPWRRMTRHFWQILLTLGLTFTVCLSASPDPPSGLPDDRDRTFIALLLLVAVDDAPAGEVVGRQLHDDPILGQDADVVLPHLAADVCQDLVAVGEFHPEHGVRKWLDNSALDLDGPIFFRHSLRYLTSRSLTRAPRPFTLVFEVGSRRARIRCVPAAAPRSHRRQDGHGRVDAARRQMSVRVRSALRQTRPPRSGVSEPTPAEMPGIAAQLRRTLYRYRRSCAGSPAGPGGEPRVALAPPAGAHHGAAHRWPDH